MRRCRLCQLIFRCFRLLPGLGQQRPQTIQTGFHRRNLLLQDSRFAVLCRNRRLPFQHDRLRRSGLIFCLPLCLFGLFRLLFQCAQMQLGLGGLIAQRSGFDASP